MVLRQKANLKTGVTRKQSTPNFPEYENLLRLDTHTCVCVSGGKKCLFFGKFSVICFLVTTFLRFALLSYRRINIIILAFHYAHKVTKKAGIRQENMITRRTWQTTQFLQGSSIRNSMDGVIGEFFIYSKGVLRFFCNFILK